MKTISMIATRAGLAAAFMALGLAAYSQPGNADEMPSSDPAAPADAGTNSPAPLVQRQITLGALGFRDGISLSGFSGNSDIYFPVPGGVALNALRLEGQLNASLPAPIRGSVRFDVDQQPVWSAAPGTGPIPFALSLPAPRTDQSFLKLGVAFGATWTANRCADQRLPGGFVTLSPQTTLSYRFDPAAISDLRSAVAVLPLAVRIGLPATLASTDALQTGLAIALELQKAGHQVSFVTAPASLDGADGKAPSADIVLLPAAELASLARSSPTATPGAALLHAGRYPVIALADNAGAGTARFLTAGWARLADGTGALVRESQNGPANAAGTLGFAALGLGSGIRDFAERGEWEVGYDYPLTPGGKKPAALNIQLIPGSIPSGEPQLVHIFVNDLLLRSVTVDAGQPSLTAHVPLPDGLLGLRNAIRVVLQRPAASGSCQEALMATPAQLLPGSTVEFADDATKPADFFQLAAAFKAGVTVEVPKSALADPVPALTLALRTLEGLKPGAEGLAVTVGDGRQPATPFVLLPGAGAPADIKRRIEADAGALRLTDRSGRVLLDLSGSRAILTAQLVEAGGQPGLLLEQAGDTAVQPATLLLDRGNVAFADASGTIVAMNTEKSGALQIEVQGAAGWQDWIDRFRIALIVIAWLAITVLAAGLLSRHYRKRGQSDK
ncbi:hypothetical protein [Radicibacter daui]|uniref:hypothetical protein n=1 Tax=Radicibacter daui TaxID=3064829 RepID=UPI004046A698